MKRAVIICIAVNFCLMCFIPLAFSQTKSIKPLGSSKSIKNDATTKKTAPASAYSKKIQNFLNTIEKAKSIDEIGKSFKNSRFSKKELKQLEPLLKKKPYSTKLEDIEKKTNAMAKRKSKAEVLRIQKQREQQVKQKNQRRLKQKNQLAVKSLQALKGKVPATVRQSIQGELRAANVPSSVAATAAGDRFENLPRIRSISPRPVIPGGAMTLTGENFGSSAGTVTVRFSFEGTTWNIRCTVNSGGWNDHRIVATPPEWLRHSVGESNKDVRVFIRTDQGGASMEVQLGPDPASLQPEITGLSRTSIEPEQIIIIEGRNFLSESNGRVEFSFGGQSPRGIIEDWGPNFISVRLPDSVQGIPETDGVMTVINHRGYRASRSITFEPALDMKTYHRDYWMHCHAWSLGFLGAKEEKTFFNVDLINGWKVKEAWLEVDVHGPGGGARYLVQPQVGSTRAHSRVEIWAEAFSRTDLDEYIIIEGPKGLADK